MIQNINIDQSIGRTIKAVYKPSYDNMLILVFTDNTYSYLRAANGYDGDTELNNDTLLWDEIGEKIVELGILSEEEYTRLDREQTEKGKQAELYRKRKLFESLKREFGQ